MYGFMPVFRTQWRSIGLLVRSPLPWRSSPSLAMSTKTKVTNSDLASELQEKTKILNAYLKKWMAIVPTLTKPSALEFANRLCSPNMAGLDANLQDAKAMSTKTKATNSDLASELQEKTKILNAYVKKWMAIVPTLTKRSALEFTNGLCSPNMAGLDTNLKDANEREGTLVLYMQEMMSRSSSPEAIMMFRVGDFYVSIGLDACFLLEYTNSKALHSEGAMISGFPAKNLRNILDVLMEKKEKFEIHEEFQGITRVPSIECHFRSGDMLINEAQKNAKLDYRKKTTLVNEAKKSTKRNKRKSG